MKTREELEQEYVRSYDKREGIIIIAILAAAVACIVLGFTLPV